MSVLVLGGTGMLGHKIVQTMEAQGMIVSCTFRGRRSDFPATKVPFYKLVEVHEYVDATDLPELCGLLSKIKPDHVINCIGIIKQRSEANSAIPSITVNSLLPHLLAEWAQEWGGRVVHFSTDCVFSGNRGSYTVTDASDADDLYGKSKYLGEVQRSNAITIRSSIIGRELSNFASLVEWFLSQGGRTVNGYTRAMYSGMTTQTMADLVVAIVNRGSDLSGLHQVVSEKISKYELLLALRDAFRLDVTIVPSEDVMCDRSMCGSGFEKNLDFAIPSWAEQIEGMAEDKTPYGAWR
jgi:dTDP-4-dehydrorhamnose reductase